MGGNLVETLIGAAVLAVATFFLIFAYGRADVGAVAGYEVEASFEASDGIGTGTDVRLAGIKIGTVIKQVLDPETYLAVIRMSINPAVKLPVDTSASIVSDGLLGSKYMSLVPGAEEEMIEDGGQIIYTQSSVSLEQLIAKFMFSDTKDKPAEK